MKRFSFAFGHFVLLGIIFSNVFACAFNDINTPEFSAQNEPVFAARLNDYLQAATAANNFSGAVLVAQNDKILFEKAYGIANRDRNALNSVDTRFNLGSMNKMFTAVSIAQLAEKGKISFDDPFIKYLPDYPDKAIAEKVTVHQLLTHTSGLGTYFNEKFRLGNSKVKSVKDFFPFFVGEPLAFEPGTRWQYSNVGFIILGAIVEKVSGQDYYDYVNEHIYKPAGMKNTGFYGPTEKDNELVAMGYIKEPGGDKPTFKTNTEFRDIKGGPAGGGYSTVRDMFRFSQALNSHKLLSAKYTDLVTTGKVDAPIGKYGYGFGNEPFQGKMIIGHNGGGPGIGAQFDMFPDSNLVIVVLGNYDYRLIQPVIRSIRNTVLGLPDEVKKQDVKKDSTASVNAQNADQAKAESDLQKVPQGKTILDFISALNSGDIAKMREFQRSHGGNENNADRDLGFYQETGGLKLHSVVINGNSFTVLAQTQKIGDWMKLEFVLGTEAPYPLKGLRISPAPAP